MMLTFLHAQELHRKEVKPKEVVRLTGLYIILTKDDEMWKSD